MMRKTLISAFAAIAATATAQAGAIVETPAELQETFDMIVEHTEVDAKLYVVTSQARNQYDMLSGMARNALGYAVNTESGGCFVFIREEIANSYRGHYILEHEIGHCVAWEMHGDSIGSGHGREFKAACQTYSTNINSCKASY